MDPQGGESASLRSLFSMLRPWKFGKDESDDGSVAGAAGAGELRQRRARSSIWQSEHLTKERHRRPWAHAWKFRTRACNGDQPLATHRRQALGRQASRSG